MKVAFACDHAGFALKEAVIAHLKEMGHEVVDFGCYTPERVDYPAQGEKAARAVASGECALGVLICGTGIGISLAANKVPGIRCAVCSDTYSAKYTRLHNAANLLALGERVVGPGLAMEIVDAFLSTPFEGGRHAARVEMISEIEKKYNK